MSASRPPRIALSSSKLSNPITASEAVTATSSGSRTPTVSVSPLPSPRLERVKLSRASSAASSTAKLAVPGSQDSALGYSSFSAGDVDTPFAVKEDDEVEENEPTGGMTSDSDEDATQGATTAVLSGSAMALLRSVSSQSGSTLSVRAHRMEASSDTLHSLRGGESGQRSGEPAPAASVTAAQPANAEEEEDSFPPRQYFILSNAGKPVYVSHLATRGKQARARQAQRAGETTGELAGPQGEGQGALDLSTGLAESDADTIAKEDEAEERATAQVGVMAALMSVFADQDGDKIRSISAGSSLFSDGGPSSRTRITFLVRGPLYLVAVSSWGEPASTMRTHLEYLHLCVLSLVSLGQLNRLFKRMANLDLRRLLEGTDGLLGSLISRLQLEVALPFGVLQPLRLRPGLRDAVAAALRPPARTEARPKDLLYIILLANERIVTVIRPRKHSISPSDMHLLINTAHGSSALKEPGAENWVPICLPKFAPQGFVHAYVSFLERPSLPKGQPMPDSKSEVALIIVTGDRDAFPSLRQWRHEISESLTASGTLSSLYRALPASAYSADDLHITGLRHFIYKSRENVQITAPRYEAPYDVDDSLDDSEEPSKADIGEHRERASHMKRLVTLYSLAHDAIHAPGRTTSPSDLILFESWTSTASISADTSSLRDVRTHRRPAVAGPVKMQYLRTPHEAVLGWITQPFELYMTVHPRLPKKAVVAAANAVVKWVRSKEHELFLTSSPVF